jgi:hypothetical protein
VDLGPGQVGVQVAKRITDLTRLNEPAHQIGNLGDLAFQV